MTQNGIAEWLIGEARLLGSGTAIVDGFCMRLVAAGVPLWRVRVGQRLANPLLAAWGVLWQQGEVSDYVIPVAMLETGTWLGSPFHTVTEKRAPFRRRLVDLDPTDDHTVLHELAAAGGTDFLAMPLEYGDGSVQGMSLATDDPRGFDDGQMALMASLRHALAAAMEPVAMRRSMASLLQTYLGAGPSAAVVAGAIRRGDPSSLDAVVLVSDLRGFTEKSAAWSEAALLEALGQYFETVVTAVHARGGDVLKFIGDGILAVFPITDGASAAGRCADALSAAREARAALARLNAARAGQGQPGLDFGIALHRGPVTYGNIGSPDRLDFTVIGETVNVASRVEGLTKTLSAPILCTAAVADPILDDTIGDADHAGLRPLGAHPVRGLSEPVTVFAVEGGA